MGLYGYGVYGYGPAVVARVYTTRQYHRANEAPNVIWTKADGVAEDPLLRRPRHCRRQHEWRQRWLERETVVDDQHVPVAVVHDFEAE